MKRFALILSLLVVIALLAVAAFLFIPHRLEEVARPAGMPAGEALVARGKYLATAADCIACHTAPGGKAFAGGLPFKLPFGTIYSPNITPDPDTGIGTWSDAEFVRSMHRGIGKNGEDLYPAYPYTSYALTSDGDALAIKAYLFSLPAVRATAPPNTLSFPYNQRYLMRFWKLLFLPAHPEVSDSEAQTGAGRGRYLVEALAHCGECHTPRNQLFGLQQSRKFAGAIAQGWNAYNITSDKQEGIGAWSDEELASYLSTGHAQGHGSASGNMAEAISMSLRHLSSDDIQAIVAYLRTISAAKSDPPLPPVEPKPRLLTASSPTSPSPEELRRASLGLALFQGSCASCHAWNGEGVQTPYAALTGAQTVNDPAGTNLMQVLLHGVRLETAHGTFDMPNFSRGYRDVELAALANFVIEHFGGKSGAVRPSNIAEARRSSEAQQSQTAAPRDAGQ
jgi:mono/diheme cytochrome c family protein